MLFRMAYIQRKTPNGTFYYRRRLPSDLIEILGKREIKLSLKTKDPIVAQVQAKRVTNKLEAEWKSLRKPKPLLTEAQELVSALDTTQTYTETTHGTGEITYDEDGWSNFLDTLDNRKATVVEEKALQMKYDIINLSDAVFMRNNFFFKANEENMGELQSFGGM